MFSSGPILRGGSLERAHIVRHRNYIGYVYRSTSSSLFSMGDLRKNFLIEDSDIVYISD